MHVFTLNLKSNQYGLMSPGIQWTNTYSKGPIKTEQLQFKSSGQFPYSWNTDLNFFN